MTDERRIDEGWTLHEALASLPQGHHERPGLARAIELLNVGALSDIEALRGLSEKAVPGPWGWRPFGGDPANFCRIVVYPPAVETWAVVAEDMEPENAEFIAAACNFVRGALAAAVSGVAGNPDE